MYGDRNTAFFHRSVVIKRQKSAIRCLKDSVGNVIFDPIELSVHIRSFYANLYSTEKY